MTPAGYQHLERFGKAMAATTGKPLLYGPNGRSLAPTGGYTLGRKAAKRTGNLKNWRPRKSSPAWSRRSSAPRS